MLISLQTQYLFYAFAAFVYIAIALFFISLVAPVVKKVDPPDRIHDIMEIFIYFWLFVFFILSSVSSITRSFMLNTLTPELYSQSQANQAVSLFVDLFRIMLIIYGFVVLFEYKYMKNYKVLFFNYGIIKAFYRIKRKCVKILLYPAWKIYCLFNKTDKIA